MKRRLSMNLLVISGSAFPDSHTNAVARIIESLVEQPEHKVTVIDLCGWDIPVLGQGNTMDIEGLKHLAHEADAIMIGTPNYHTSYSGILKNSLDNLPINEFEMTYVGLLYNIGAIEYYATV